MSSDSVGSRRGRGSNARSLRGLRSDLIDPTLAVHKGRMVKRTGDGSIVEFRSVVGAVRCAIEMMRGMIERNAGVPAERRIEFRVGIQFGDVVEETTAISWAKGSISRLASKASPNLGRSASRKKPTVR